MNLETIAVLLSQATSGDVIVDDAPVAPFHPQAFSFYDETPRRSPTLSGSPPILETLLAFNEAGDFVKLRIERMRDTVYYFNLDYANGTCGYVTGQGLVCEKGSDAESVFIQNALADVVRLASGPLLGVMTAVRSAKLELSSGCQDMLRQELFGA